MALPKTFTAGERLFAEDLNEALEYLDGELTSLDASNIVTGTLDADRIPGLNASKITAGTLDEARLGNVPSANLTGNGFPIRIASGTSAGSNSSAGTTITFPAGRFSSTPQVASSSISGDNFRINTIGGLSSSGFTLYTLQASGTFNAHTVNWIAVQL